MPSSRARLQDLMQAQAEAQAQVAAQVEARVAAQIRALEERIKLCSKGKAHHHSHRFIDPSRFS